MDLAAELDALVNSPEHGAHAAYLAADVRRLLPALADPTRAAGAVAQIQKWADADGDGLRKRFSTALLDRINEPLRKKFIQQRLQKATWMGAVGAGIRRSMGGSWNPLSAKIVRGRVTHSLPFEIGHKLGQRALAQARRSPETEMRASEAGLIAREDWMANPDVNLVGEAVDAGMAPAHMVSDFHSIGDDVERINRIRARSAITRAAQRSADDAGVKGTINAVKYGVPAVVGTGYLLGSGAINLSAPFKPGFFYRDKNKNRGELTDKQREQRRAAARARWANRRVATS